MQMQRSALSRKACSLKMKGGCARNSIVCSAAPENNAAATAKPIRGDLPADVLTGDDLSQWQATVTMVEEVGFSVEEAEEIVTRAFGWSSQLYWRKSKIQVIPQPEQVAESIAYLKSNIAKPADFVKIVKGFPECIALAVEGGPPGLKYAVQFIKDEWDMDGVVFNMVLAKKPKLLGNSVDCKGTCAGMCHQCWATS